MICENDNEKMTQKGTEFVKIGKNIFDKADRYICPKCGHSVLDLQGVDSYMKSEPDNYLEVN